MVNIYKKFTFFLLSILFVHAADIEISGFATVAIGKNDRDDATLAGYGNTIDNNSSASNGNKIKFQPDSVAGIQFNTRFDEKLTAAVQLVSRFRDKSAQVNLEWAYFNYDYCDEIRVQTGRFRAPVYLFSNTKDVGYSYLWTRTPRELYAQVPFSYLDGVNVDYHFETENEYIFGLNIYGGNVDNELHISAGTFDFQFDDLFGLELSVKNDVMKVRAGYSRSIVNGDLSPLSPSLNSIDNVQVVDILGQFMSLGVSFEGDKVIFISEASLRLMEPSIFADKTEAFYATLGYRINKYTPHISFSTVKGDSADSDINVYTAKYDRDQDTITLGLQYQLSTTSVLKAEYKRSDRRHLGSDTTPAGIINLVTLAWSSIF